MHIAYWGIHRSPFASHIDPIDYYPSAVHEEAWARLDFLINHGRRLGFLTGSSGIGKSLLLEVATQHLRQVNAHVVKLNVVGLGPDEFVWKVAASLGHLASPNATTVECWQAISDRLIANRYQRTPTVVMLDDIDDTEREVHLAISRLTLIDSHPEARFTILLTGQRQRMSGLSNKLNDLCDLRIDLEPWETDETARYLEFAMQQVGAQPDIFSHDSMTTIHELSRGIPRRVRQLAELSLLAGAAEELERITPAVIESVQASLTVNGVSEAV